MHKTEMYPRHHATGQDSEFFIWDEEKEQVVSSHLFFAPKGESFPDQDDIKLFRDGLAMEINSPPEHCIAYLINNIQRGVSRAQQTVNAKKASGSQFRFTTRPWVEVSQELVETFPPDLLELGCSPTFNAYTMERQTVRVNPRTLGFRTSGSHLHMSLGNTVPSHEALCNMIKASDLILGVPFALLFNDSLEFKRRALYGKAGEFRRQVYEGSGDPQAPPVYGLEYRVLSSRLWDHTSVASLFFQLWKYIIGTPAKMRLIEEKWDTGWEATIQEAINLGTPGALLEAEKIWQGFFPLIHDPSKQSHWAYWNLLFSPNHLPKLKEISKKFHDLGIAYSHLPEAHDGYSEYAAAWGLGADPLRSSAEYAYLSARF